MPVEDREHVVTTASPTLREIATVLMKVSQNLYAETFLKALGPRATGLGTAEGGRMSVRSTLSRVGCPRDAHILYDGSGLSRYTT